MANPNDPALKAQQETLDAEITQLKTQLAASPDDQSLKDQLAAKEAAMKQLNDQLKTSRDQYRQDNPPGKSSEAPGRQGQGRADAPGQQKKQQP